MKFKVRHTFLLGLLMAALATACKTKVEQHTSEIKHDSTHTEVREVVRAIPVKVAADSAFIMSLVHCPPVIVERDTYYVQPVAIPETKAIGHRNASINISLVDGVLKAKANCNELEQLVYAKDQYISRYTKLYKEHKNSLFKTTPVPYVPRWVYWLVGLNIALALYYTIKVLRKFKVLPF